MADDYEPAYLTVIDMLRAAIAPFCARQRSYLEVEASWLSYRASAMGDSHFPSAYRTTGSSSASQLSWGVDLEPSVEARLVLGGGAVAAVLAVVAVVILLRRRKTKRARRASADTPSP